MNRAGVPLLALRLLTLGLLASLPAALLLALGLFALGLLASLPAALLLALRLLAPWAAHRPPATLLRSLRLLRDHRLFSAGALLPGARTTRLCRALPGLGGRDLQLLRRFARRLLSPSRRSRSGSDGSTLTRR